MTGGFHLRPVGLQLRHVPASLASIARPILCLQEGPLVPPDGLAKRAGRRVQAVPSVPTVRLAGQRVQTVRLQALRVSEQQRDLLAHLVASAWLAGDPVRTAARGMCARPLPQRVQQCWPAGQDSTAWQAGQRATTASGDTLARQQL